MLAVKPLKELAGNELSYLFELVEESEPAFVAIDPQAESSYLGGL